MPTNLPALLRSDGWHAPVTCKVVDFSSRGARVRFGERDRLSKSQQARLAEATHLTLRLRLERIEADCRMVWRNATELGVAFLAAPRLLGR